MTWALSPPLTSIRWPACSLWPRESNKASKSLPRWSQAALAVGTTLHRPPQAEVWTQSAVQKPGPCCRLSHLSPGLPPNSFVHSPRELRSLPDTQIPLLGCRWCCCLGTHLTEALRFHHMLKPMMKLMMPRDQQEEEKEAEPHGSKIRSPLGWFLPGSLKRLGANAEENMNQQPGQEDSTLKSEMGTEGQIRDSWGHQSDVFFYNVSILL